MKNLFLLLTIVLFSSCGHSDGNSVTGTAKIKDSALYYYTQSLDTNLSLTDKKQAANKSIYFAKKRKTDSLYLNILYQKELLSLSLGEYDSLVDYNKDVVEQAMLTNDVSMLARQHYFMGYFYDHYSNLPDSAFNNYKNSKNYFAALNDSLWAGKTLLSMAIVQKDQNDFFGSKETVTEAITYLNGDEHREEMVQCYNLLATNHRKLLNFEDALAYFQKALDLTDSAQEVFQFKNNLAVTYIDYGKYQRAVDILKEIIDDPSLDRTTTQYARILDNLSYAKWLLDGRDETEALIKALKIRSQKNDRRGQISSYTHLGESNMKRNPDAAMAYFDTVINIARKIRMPRAETDALMFIMQLQPHNIWVRNRYIILKDSLEKEELMVKTQFAKYKYDDKQKQESILRLEKEKAEQTLLATRERSWKIMSYLGSIILLLGLSFAIYFFRQRTKRLKEETKTAKLVATLETEADMSRRLHDDFGAGLNQTMLMLQGDADKSKILDRLDVLYNQSRSFSREVNEVDTGPNFKEELSEMLRFRTPSQTNLIITGAKDMDWDSIQPLSKMVIYKILQELMINMGKHSNATLTTIGFKVSGNTLSVNYSDNGVGASKRELNSKNGLRNTEKRIQAIGGSITFDSDKGAGFNANMIVPV